MNTPSEQAVAQRWDNLTPALREALFSDANDEFIEQLCKSQYLPEEKIDDVSERAGYVILGFLHPEDLSEELVKSVGLKPQIADSISGNINQRIFSPLKDELAKTFAPATKAETISGTNKPTASSGPKILSQSAAGSMNVSTAPIPGSKP